ncbi:MAG TPA: HD domain-containing protein [Candidatus Izemoplasmatales bacterium]|nr:HD domain-containing protein [Candidatus Izemoplasmatales bacterium]
MSNIDRTIKYVQDLFDKSEYLKDKPKQKEYRLEHTYRVASIGKEIAQKENLDIDALVVGCLLHDISYIYEMESEDDSLNHGRKSAQIAREFVMGLDMDAKFKNELLYGIAIHVDDKADFEGERTVLAESIGEADNIDRFDRYRLYENLLYSNLSNMSLDEQMGYASKRVERLKNLKKYVFRTKTSNRMWNEKLDYQIGYYEGLLEQLQKSDCEKL